MDETLAEFFRRTILKIPMTEMMTILKTWNFLSENQLQTVNFRQRKESIVQDLVLLCEVTVFKVINLEYHTTLRFSSLFPFLSPKEIYVALGCDWGGLCPTIVEKVLIFNWIFQLTKNGYKLVRKKKSEYQGRRNKEVKIMSSIFFKTIRCQRWKDNTQICWSSYAERDTVFHMYLFTYLLFIFKWFQAFRKVASIVQRILLYPYIPSIPFPHSFLNKYTLWPSSSTSGYLNI